MELQNVIDFSRGGRTPSAGEYDVQAITDEKNAQIESLMEEMHQLRREIAMGVLLYCCGKLIS